MCTQYLLETRNLLKKIPNIFQQELNRMIIRVCDAYYIICSVSLEPLCFKEPSPFEVMKNPPLVFHFCAQELQ